MPKLTFIRGGPGRRPTTWEVSRPGVLSRDYVFHPGVPVDVADADAAILCDPAQSRGRVFDVADEVAAAPASQERQAPPPAERRTAKLDTPAAASAAAQELVGEVRDLAGLPAIDPKPNASPGKSPAGEN